MPYLLGQPRAAMKPLRQSLQLCQLPEQGSPWQRGQLLRICLKKQKPSKQYDIAYHFEGGFQNRGSTSVCRSKPITAAAAPRYSPAGFPRRAVRAHFTHAAANRLPANGPFSLSSSPLRYSARVNAFFLIHLYYSRAGGRSQAKRRRWHFSGSSAPIQSISCFLQKCLLAKYIPAQMAMASTR